MTNSTATKTTGHWVVDVYTARGWGWGGAYHATAAEAIAASPRWVGQIDCWQVWISRWVDGVKVEARPLKGAVAR